ncbi:hypothetical protein C8F01DRAFT_513963 [Mycena amicta]|nr:hypothetical protein C8F01DRAFT_513963 [Mycena amicta]
MIQELVEVIVDFLYDSQTDLRRCCLVGKAWLPVARFHLFAYFALASGGECRRLAHMQDYAPHLLDLITHLAIGLSSQDVDASWAYSFLEKITFTRLRRLSILTLPPADSLPVLQNIIAQPQVSHVTVKPTDDNRLMFSLFRYRTAGLKTLEVRSRHYEEAMGMGMGAPPLANRFPVECLRLETISKKLDDPAVSPFDMQDLKHLEICDYIASESFEGILQQLGSLSSLDIATYFSASSSAFLNEVL